MRCPPLIRAAIASVAWLTYTWCLAGDFYASSLTPGVAAPGAVAQRAHGWRARRIDSDVGTWVSLGERGEPIAISGVVVVPDGTRRQAGVPWMQARI
jgi:hypothetical protein